jgi:fatty acid desaturase
MTPGPAADAVAAMVVAPAIMSAALPAAVAAVVVAGVAVMTLILVAVAAMVPMVLRHMEIVDMTYNNDMAHESRKAWRKYPPCNYPDIRTKAYVYTPPMQ